MFFTKKHCFLFFLLTSLNLQSFSQNLVGLSVLLNKPSSSTASPGIGLNYERILDKHNSLETGLYYRTCTDKNMVAYFITTDDFGAPLPYSPLKTVQYAVKQQFLSIPLLYKYRSNAINIAIGPTIDIFTGWNEKEHTVSSTYIPTYIPPSSTVYFVPDRNMQSRLDEPLPVYTFDNHLLIGMMARVSKTIQLNDNFSIEPAVYFNPVFTKYSIYNNYRYERKQFYAVEVATKYKL